MPQAGSPTAKAATHATPGMLAFCLYAGLVGGLVALAAWLVAREPSTPRPV